MAPVKQTNGGRLRLKDVTVAAADCIRADLAARALSICLDKCSFADAVLFTDAPVDGPFRCETIAPLRSTADYSRFCLQDMPGRIATRFVLVVQWDGYVADPAAWTPDFLRYDYIGSVTSQPDGRGGSSWMMGNGGFSLRSRKLLDALPSLPLVPGLSEDVIICRTFRPALERDHHIRFAPEEIADRFSYEQRPVGHPTFGFHGIENLHRVESDAEVLRLLDRLTPAERSDGRLLSPINQALKAGRLELAVSLFDRIRAGASSATLKAVATRVFRSEAYAAWIVTWLEALVRARDSAGITGTEMPPPPAAATPRT